MRMRIAILIGTVVAVLFVVAVWHREQEQMREVRAITDQFWTAVTAGDAATVASLLAPDAAVPAKDWVEQNAGMRYFAQQTEITTERRMSCSPWMTATVTVQAGKNGYARMSILKQVDGRWVVYEPNHKICPDTPGR